jgi:hypothetical protein
MSYTYSIPGSATFSKTFPFDGDIFSQSGLDQMMGSLPDNDSNLISARDVRDSVFTLWKRGDELKEEIIATISNFKYTNPEPLSSTLGGWEIGDTFNETPLQELFDTLFYPYVGPILSIDIVPQFGEFGQFNSTLVNWSVQKTKEIIQDIKLNNVSISPVTGDSQSGTASVPISISATFSIYTLEVFDGSFTQSITATFSNKNLIYWGSVSSISSTFLESDIKNLTFSILSNDLELIADGLDGGGDYLAFSWPSNFGEPVFETNGLINTAFTKIHGSGGITSSIIYTSGSYSTTYDFWVSDYQQNSPIDKFEIYRL